MSTQDLQRRWSSALMNNYGTPKVALERGAGAVVYDADGKRYLDFLGGIAVNSLGHAHPAILEAVCGQLGTLGHVSNLYASEPVVELAERLLAHFGNGSGKAFFCNSGTEANEAAFKIARLTGRRKIIACDEAFHGRTMGALALTGQASKRAPFEPMPPGVVHIPYGDSSALAWGGGPGDPPGGGGGEKGGGRRGGGPPPPPEPAPRPPPSVVTHHPGGGPRAPPRRQRRGIPVRNVDDARRHRLERRPLRRLPGQRQRAHGPAVERLVT
ncbi:aminotransferase class III-fold pyridoxal phosphate-dependent enzyme, partial [Nocardia wallacei]|uniref:aminotransferase class III-fold pyridoxal phosphate-dependent enzyme n=1 Tax=Nocardia wallacei TaxID=480035 RepID=UPI002457ACCA